MSFGSKIKELRLEKGLTQKQLGDLCGMADSAIRRYESDRGNPTVKTLKKFAAALNVPLEVLYFDYIDYSVTEEWAGIEYHSEEERHFIHKAIQDDVRKTLELRDELRIEKFCNSPNGRAIISAYFELNDLGQTEAVNLILHLAEKNEFLDKRPEPSKYETSDNVEVAKKEIAPEG